MLFFLFLGVILIVSTCVGIWVGLRSAQAFFPRRWQRVVWMIAVLLFAFSFVIGFFVPYDPWGRILRLVGAGWVNTLPYWFIALILFEGAAFIDRRRPFFPEWTRRNPLLTKKIACISCVLVVILILFRGYWNFSHPQTTSATVSIAKKLPGRNSLRVAIASDLHLGELINKADLARYVAQINAVKADIVLLPGDLIDNRVNVLWEQKMDEELSRLKAPLGVYAVLGNHDSFGGASTAIAEFFEKSGIHVLRDEVKLVDGSFYVVGRRDKQEGRQRLPLANILQGIDFSKPVIVVDHQPANSHLREAAEHGVDLQISGHTHGGQVWPVTWLVPFLYRVCYGAGKEGNMTVYVTSGLGLWGFPVRIGSVSEVVDMRIEFGK
ncbi:MAG: metallophosphoesterase [Puniceicoccales bacterium]|jgi:predicted MPP superfamily phosphohydrolase|nr:metallophosphoesterase [Puniceicoccales bacterium]